MESSLIRLLLVFGGKSPEHSVSCVGAMSVLKHLDRSRFEVIPVGIAKSGSWHLLEMDEDGSVALEGTSAEPLVPGGSLRAHLLMGNDQSEAQLAVEDENGRLSVREKQIDIAFPLLHGDHGEDGTIQGLFEMAGVPYVGPSVLASALGMDKEFMKQHFLNSGLEVGPYTAITSSEFSMLEDCDLSLKCKNLRFPLFVKPARGGSSIGVTRVDSVESLRNACDFAFRFDSKILIEQGIDGRELMCGVLGKSEGDLQASVLGEIGLQDGAVNHDFNDYSAKYLDTEAKRYDCPANIDSEISRDIREKALLSYKSLECTGLARVDFFYTDDGHTYVNEINTMPGFSKTSMFPRLWSATGVDYEELITRVICAELQ